MKTRRIFLVIICMFSIVNIGICQQSVSDKDIDNKLQKLHSKLYSKHGSLYRMGNFKYMFMGECYLNFLDRFSKNDSLSKTIFNNVLYNIKNNDVFFYNNYYKGAQKETYYMYPIIYVSYEQVLHFCKIVEKSYNDIYVKKDTALFKIVVRLPSKEEFQEVYSMFNPDNCIKNCGIDTTGKGLDLKNTLKHYFSYKSKKYNTCSFLYGNVAEMTDVKGVAMGGSWAHDCSYCSPDKLIYYDKPEPWLGFRLVFEVVRK